MSGAEGKMRLKFTILSGILLLTLFSTAFAIDSDELPFGSFYLYSYADSEVEKLSRDMCFNYMCEYDTMSRGQIRALMNHDIQAVRGGIIPNDTAWYLAEAEDPMKYSWTNYAVVGVDYTPANPEVRMVPFGGHFEDGGSLWVSEVDSVDTLSGISTRLPIYAEAEDSFYGQQMGPYNYVPFFSSYLFDFPRVDNIPYNFDIYMKIDRLGPDSTDTVASVSVSLGDFEACSLYVEQIGVIRADSFTADNTMKAVKMHFMFPNIINYKHWESGSCVANADTVGGGRIAEGLYLTLVTTGKRKVSVDSIVIYDQDGWDLMDGQHYADIRDVFDDYDDMGDSLYGWDFMDEPSFTNLVPMAYIDTVMAGVYPGWTTWTDNNTFFPAASTIHSYFSAYGNRATYLNPDPYPFAPGSPYCGIVYQDSTSLRSFDRCLSWIRAAIDQEARDFWTIIQAFDGQHWRYPTAPELSVQTFMALAWGAKGIMPWPYDNNPEGGRAIRDDDASHTPTPLYDEIKNHIGPYLQAFDEYYMPLEWDTAYVYHPTYHPTSPTGALVSSISAACSDPDSAGYNPDIGWFQVGEYYRGDDKYFMLVNRACNQEDGTEAPSITATVFFNRQNLAIGDRVRITDLARETRFNNSTKQWEAVPETISAGGSEIAFTTTFRAGEGRIFKISRATEESTELR